MPSPLALTLCILTCCAAFDDLRARRIGNPLNAGALLSALILHLMCAPWPQACAVWLGGAATGLLVFLPLYAMRGMAAGDVKLMTAVGGFCGAAPALRIALGAALIGGVMALLMALHAGHLRRTFASLMALCAARLNGKPYAAATLPQAGAATLPYGAAICLATVAVCAGY
jgi:prepilin peptidase CpaA